MQNLLLLLFTVFSFSQDQQIFEKEKSFYTLTVNFQQGSCDNPQKAWQNLHSQLSAIKAVLPNMAVVQVIGHSWEGNVNGVPLCSCRAQKVLNFFNRWASSNSVGQSFGIATCQTHIHSGSENQRVEILIDATF